MMYIENASLEDKVKYSLRGHSPSNNIARSSYMLAHVSEAEEVATNLRLQAQVAGALCNGAAAVDRNCVSNGPTHEVAHQSNTNVDKRKQNNSINAKKREGENIDYIDIDGAEGAKEETLTEQEDKEIFELFEIEDLAEETIKQEKPVEQEHKETNKPVREEKDPSESLSESEVHIEIEGQDRFEYLLTKVRKHTSKKKDLLQKIQEFTDKNTDKKSRPVPGLIPLEEHFNIDDGRPQQQTYKTAPRILNGILPILGGDSDSDSDNDTDIDIATGPAQNSNNLRTRFRSSVDELLRRRKRNRYQDSQMGFELWSTLCRLFTGSDNEKQDNRKRRAETFPADDQNLHQFKYRKVENRFPKYITRTLEDDDPDFITKFQSKWGRRQYQQNKFINAKPMAERKTLNTIAERPNVRESMFEAPRTTQKLINNTSYADLEFSDDDDEPEVVRAYEHENRATGTVKKQPKVLNIPIRQTPAGRSAFTHNVPVSLFNKPSGSNLASTVSAAANVIRKPTYAEALRQPRIPMANIDLTDRGAVSSASSSGASTSATPRGFNSNMNFWITDAHSVLNHEKQAEERKQYQQLLAQMIPFVYGTENSTVQSLAKRRSVLPADLSTASHKSSTGNRRPFVLPTESRFSLKRPPLSSTVNIDDDDDGNGEDEDVTFVGVSRSERRPPRTAVQSVIIDDDNSSDVEICDQQQHYQQQQTSKDDTVISVDLTKAQKNRLPYVERVNTLHERLFTSPHLKDDWLGHFNSKWNQRKKIRQQELHDQLELTEKIYTSRLAAEPLILERLREFKISDPDCVIIDEFPEPIEEVVPEFVELNADHQARIKAALSGPADQVLVSKFNLNITRRDIFTLTGNNWLNDEVINFYMNLLTERGEKKHDSHGLPRVYAMNTFFVQRLLQNGFGGVKRWTRKIDIFAKDVIPVPVHVGGVHWCMAIIHLKNRSIKYYDSMGSPNPNILKALEQYLKDESMDKLKQPYDTSGFVIESVRDVPRQMNGSDCGVFSCMFAEYITRDKAITFSQQHMEYFRHKMILEIVRGELLQ